jgi:hypothetical protein
MVNSLLLFVIFNEHARLQLLQIMTDYLRNECGDQSVRRAFRDRAFRWAIECHPFRVEVRIQIDQTTARAWLNWYFRRLIGIPINGACPKPCCHSCLSHANLKVNNHIIIRKWWPIPCIPFMTQGPGWLVVGTYGNKNSNNNNSMASISAG